MANDLYCFSGPLPSPMDVARAMDALKPGLDALEDEKRLALRAQARAAVAAAERQLARELEPLAAERAKLDAEIHRLGVAMEPLRAELNGLKARLSPIEQQQSRLRIDANVVDGKVRRAEARLEEAESVARRVLEACKPSAIDAAEWDLSHIAEKLTPRHAFGSTTESEAAWALWSAAAVALKAVQLAPDVDAALDAWRTTQLTPLRETVAAVGAPTTEKPQLPDVRSLHRPMKVANRYRKEGAPLSELDAVAAALND